MEINTFVQNLICNGKFATVCGEQSGKGSGQFNKPWGVAVDILKGRVYVSDQQNPAVQKFDTNGKFIYAKWVPSNWQWLSFYS